jgi:hypothetical protein
MWCEDPIDFGEASPKLNERHSQCRRLSSRNLEITSILTAKEDKVVNITLDFLFVMDTVSNYSMRRERWLALAGSGDYRCQGLIVWQAKILGYSSATSIPTSSHRAYQRRCAHDPEYCLDRLVGVADKVGGLGDKAGKVLAACIPRRDRCLQNKATFLTPRSRVSTNQCRER